MSTHESALPSSLAHLLIELSQDSEKREHFKNDPSLFLGNGSFRPAQIEALLSREPEMIKLAFNLRAADPPLEEIRPPAKKIPKKKVPKKKVPKKKVAKKKVAKKKVPKKK